LYPSKYDEVIEKDLKKTEVKKGDSKPKRINNSYFFNLSQSKRKRTNIPDNQLKMHIYLSDF
jgi:hypothetical protein